MGFLLVPGFALGVVEFVQKGEIFHNIVNYRLQHKIIFLLTHWCL